MLTQKIKALLRYSKHKEEPALNTFYHSLYPESVRYALAHHEARLGKSELAALVDRFVYETVYLVTKALAFAPERQRLYLENLTQFYSQPSYHLDDLRDRLNTEIKALPEDTQLAGAKLLQISRAGSDHWQTAFQHLAEQTYQDDNRVLPCIVAYTPMIGYHHFVRVFGQNALCKMQLLVPEWMLNPAEERMGYEITLGAAPTVQPQTKHACLYGSWRCLHTKCSMKHRFCEDAIFIDDTINTSTTANNLRSFWQSEYGLRVPDERVRVITNLRKLKPQTYKDIKKDDDNASDERHRTL